MLKNKAIFLSFLILFAFVLLLPQIGQTASNFTITPQNVATSTSIEYCIGFPIGGSVDEEDYFTFTWPAGFDLTGLTISDTTTESEIELYPSIDCTGTPRIVETSPGTASNSRDEASISGQVLTVTIDAGLTTGQNWSIKYVDKTDANANAIVTPGSDGNYFSEWAYFDEGTQVGQGGDLLYVGNLNEVNISAGVDPTLTLTLSGSNCNMGVFTESSIQTCYYSSTVSTNANGGYTAFVRDDGDLRNLLNEIDDIDDVGGDTVDFGVEEYGISTTEADSVDIIRIQNADGDGDYDGDDCQYLDAGTTSVNATALTTVEQSYASASAPVDSDVVYLCHAAAITGETEAGAYSHSVTITAVGNF